MASYDRAWTKGTRVRHRDGREGEALRDAEPGSTVRVGWSGGGGSSWVAGRLLTEIDMAGNEVKRR